MFILRVFLISGGFFFRKGSFCGDVGRVLFVIFIFISFSRFRRGIRLGGWIKVIFVRV